MSSTIVKQASLVCCLSLALPTAPAAPEVPANDAELPSLELLEFLGSWQTPDGEVVDPLLLNEDLQVQTNLGKVDHD